MRAPISTQKRARALRRAMTQPEKDLWSLLRRGQQGLRFRRQHPLGPFILDFYCPAVKLCVEVDGPVHEDQSAYDERRTNWLAERGIKVVRVPIADLEHRPAVILERIKQVAAPSTAFGGPLPPLTGEES